MEEFEGTKFGDLKALVDKAAKDYLKAHNGNKAAGVRVIKAMGEVKTLAHDLRKEMLNVRKQE